MLTELQALVWTLVLTLVYILAPAATRTAQYGTKWNAGPRDEEMPKPTAFTGRLERAQRNHFETLPIFIGGVLLAHMVAPDGFLAALGANLYFWSRVIYLPLYGMGVPYLRSLVWVAGLAGLLMILYAIIAL